jgi:type II secretory pathway pseudopilin PulG
MRLTRHTFSARRRPSRRSLVVGGFTLAEVLAALLFMAIVIPVTMQGVAVASRAGVMGERKAAAMRIAERVLDEQIATGQIAQATPYGTIVDGDLSYPWTLTTESWTEDLMTVVTVRVTFDVQGKTFDVAASTLYDPAAILTGTSSDSTATAATQ